MRTLVHHDPILIVANWGRPLAQSAWRAGMQSVVLDLFADLDTQRYARGVASIALPAALQIDVDKALAAAHRLAADCPALVYGAGFESNPDEIARIAAGRKIFGNTAATVRSVKDPTLFFRLLDEIGLPHPETTLRRPADARGWLAKSVGAQAGGHVRPLEAALVTNEAQHYYYQRRAEGVPHSALFLADGKRARIIGFNEQLTVAIGAAPYWYGGAISNVAVHKSIATDMTTKLDALVQRTGLVGLNSLDFIAQGARYFVLEVNPRPSATMDLYDEDCPGGLLAWHIRACQGEIVATPLASRAVRGHGVVYAAQSSRVPQHLVWPPWCSDVEAPGACVAVNAPVCMVHTQGSVPMEVKAQLEQRKRAVLAAITVN